MSQVKLAGLVACFAAGALLAGLPVANGSAADTTTTEATTETTTIVETTAPATTVVTTLEHTTTQRVVVHPATTAETTTGSNSTSTTPAWVWALVGILAVGLIALIVLLARRGGGGISPEERRRRLDMAVGTWAAQGWALESQSGDSAVLQRAGERMVVTIAPSGQVGTQLLT
jgi:hypothetical protein